MEQVWLSNYDSVKAQIQIKRKTGLPVSTAETKQIIESIQKLEKDLKTIQESPMEYEMYGLILVCCSLTNDDA